MFLTNDFDENFFFFFLNLKHFNACYRNAPLLYMVFILDCSEGILRRTCSCGYTYQGVLSMVRLMDVDFMHINMPG